MIRSFLLALIAVLGALLPACQSAPDAATDPAAGRFHTVRDDMGRTVRLPLHPRRVVSLAPSMTEMLAAVADSGQLVGRTQNCNYPASVLGLPVVNTYPLDVEAIVKLHPDAVFTVEGMTSGDNITRLEKLGIPVYQQAYDSVSDIVRGLRDLGRLLARNERGQAVADSLRAQIESLRPAPSEAPPTGPQTSGGILAITWTDPIYVYGHPTLFTDVLRLLAVRNAVPAQIPQPYPVLPRETVLKLNPDVIIGGDFRALDTTLFRRYPELKQVAAYRNRRLYAIDDDLISRPSPRIGLLIAEVARIVGAGLVPAQTRATGAQTSAKSTARAGTRPAPTASSAR